ncbi:MAG: glycosyltransferase family 2 protein [bacterium]|nr:glycosyltransferase family 2 protein [bacterium]
MEVSAVMPCRNEEETVGTCVRKAAEAIRRLGLRGEVVVVDNGSTDRSAGVAAAAGARVVREPVRGYGSAYLRGLDEARGRYIVMADSDDSYDWSDIGRFIEPLRRGRDMVMGSRFKGTIMPGAMPWLHRHVGNPILSWILRLFFGGRVSDAHCGMRALTRDAFRRLGLKTVGMEFASEMVVKACKAKLDIEEIPITLHPDGRSGRPHLRTFRDGYRHLRFMLMCSPTYLFFIPGAILMLLGFVPLIVLLRGVVWIGGHGYGTHFSLAGMVFVTLGFQIIILGLYAKTYSHEAQFEDDARFINRFYKHFSLERGLLLGALVFLAGLGIDAYVLYVAVQARFSITIAELNKAVLAATFMIMGVQIFFSSFFLSILDMKRRGQL